MKKINKNMHVSALLIQNASLVHWDNVSERFSRNGYFLEENDGKENDNKFEVLGIVQDIILEVLQYAFSSSDIR